MKILSSILVAFVALSMVESRRSRDYDDRRGRDYDYPRRGGRRGGRRGDRLDPLGGLGFGPFGLGFGGLGLGGLGLGLGLGLGMPFPPIMPPMMGGIMPGMMGGMPQPMMGGMPQPMMGGMQQPVQQQVVQQRPQQQFQQQRVLPQQQLVLPQQQLVLPQQQYGKRSSHLKVLEKTETACEIKTFEFMSDLSCTGPEHNFNCAIEKFIDIEHLEKSVSNLRIVKDSNEFVIYSMSPFNQTFNDFTMVLNDEKFNFTLYHSADEESNEGYQIKDLSCWEKFTTMMDNDEQVELTMRLSY